MLPDFTRRTDAAIQELPLQKKDKLTKAERVLAENHFLDFGESVRQHESNSNNHNVYCPQSSYFPSHILSSILDKLLVIHFPSQLEDIVNNSWIHYSSHRTALFDSIIMIQVQILAHRSSKQQTANAKQHDRRRQTADSNEDEDNCRLPSPDAVPELEEQVNQSPTRKRIAIDDITNTAKRHIFHPLKLACQLLNFGWISRGSVEDPSRLKGDPSEDNCEVIEDSRSSLGDDKGTELDGDGR